MINYGNASVCYAEITTQCNLSCPYCTIRSKDDHWNKDLFIDQLRKFEGDIILFGGEPTLHKDRLIDVVLADPVIFRKISSITTNLMYLDDQLLTLLMIIPGGVGSSYSPTRFTDDQYKTWLANIDKFGEKLPNKKIGILSTMTFELLEMNPKEMMDIMKSWNCNVIRDILFEHYVGPEVTEEYFTRCDEWLCELYQIWDTPILMRNVNRIRKWHNDCTGIYTLHPDGTMIHGCPNSGKSFIPTKCYTCEKSDVCRPCVLQPYCSYMPKFAELTKNSPMYKKDDKLKEENC